MPRSNHSLAIDAWLVVAVALLVGVSSYLVFAAASDQRASASAGSPDFGVLTLSHPSPLGPGGLNAEVISQIESGADPGPGADLGQIADDDKGDTLAYPVVTVLGG